MTITVTIHLSKESSERGVWFRDSEGNMLVLVRSGGRVAVDALF